MLEVFPLTNFASNEPSSGYAHSYRSRRSNKKISFGAFALTNFEDFHTREPLPNAFCIAWPPTSRLRDMHVLTKAGDSIRRSHLELLPALTLRIFTPGTLHIPPRCFAWPPTRRFPRAGRQAIQ